MMKTEKANRDQAAEAVRNRGRRKGKNVLYSLVCVLCSVFCVLSLTPSALAWDPAEILADYLHNHYPWEKITVRNIQIVGTQPAEEPENIILERGPLGKAVFSFINDQNTKTIVKAHVNAFDRVVKSRTPLRRGHVLTENDVFLSKMNIKKMPGNAVRKPDEIIGKALKRSISANVPVVENMIEMHQAVKRGKRVVLQINYQGMYITAAGKTREKGYVGSTVKAVNLSSNKEITGVLIDKNTIKVEL